MIRQVQSAGLAVRVTRCALALAMLLGLAWAPTARAQSSGYPPYRLYFPWSSGSFQLYLPYFHNAVSDTFTAAWPPASSAGTISSSSQSANTSVSSPAPTSVPTSSIGFVTRVGENLQLNGQPYTFVGTNVTYLVDRYFADGPQEEIISFLAQHGVQVIRVWVDPDSNLNRVEHMLDLGNKYGMRFILTLENFFNQQDGWWFKGRYLTVDLPHIANIVPRFANRPEILAWELMNEPTCPPNDSNSACWSALVNWAEVTSQAIKKLDPNHLVSVGTQRGGFDEDAMDAFRQMHALPTVDLISIHCEANKVPQQEFGQELAIAHELNKPVFFGEVALAGRSGEGEPTPNGALENRAQEIATSIRRSRAAGVDGYLLWQYGYGPIDLTNRLDYYNNDPVWNVIQVAGQP